MLFGLWNPILSCYKKSNAHLGIGFKTYSEVFLMEIKDRFAINQTPNCFFINFISPTESIQELLDFQNNH